MFQLIHGLEVANTGVLQEGYTCESLENHQLITVMVSAERMEMVYRGLLETLPAPGYFALEQQGDNKTYYLDGLDQGYRVLLFDMYHELLIHDGLIEFGFGSFSSMDTIVRTHSQTIEIRTQLVQPYLGVLETYDITRTDHLTTVESLTSGSATIVRKPHLFLGENTAQMIESMTFYGLYPVHRTEEIIENI